jgi:hypothetical protein
MSRWRATSRRNPAARKIGGGNDWRHSIRHRVSAGFFAAHAALPVYSKRDTVPDVVRVRIGTLDTPFNDKPSGHIFAASKAD